MPGTLWIVGTPIGNLGDMTERARVVLASVDVVAAEDTRRTGRLLTALGIKARLLSFFDGNEADRVPQVLGMLREGSDVALVSDAGMPSVSDPGYRLVEACVGEGIPVDVAPGPSAVTAALVVSGLPTDRFGFEGFLPRSGRGRTERLNAVARDPRTVVLFESPRRVAATLQDMLAACGDRRVAVVRELTKLHQEVLRGPMSLVIEDVRSRKLMGEVVIVLAGSPDRPGGGLEDAVAMAGRLVSGGLRKRDAAKQAAQATGAPARTIYEALVRRTG
jgi:16S rRNA (cytidine1402-2'-O)-methyltransferase